MKYIFTFLTLLVYNQFYAQLHPTCDNDRYRTEIFEEVTVTSAIKYGENTTYEGNFQELFMDIYEPAGDAAEARPVLVLAFGGSFIGGAREDIDWLCEAYARRGFVAVSIDYRLYDGPLIPLPSGETFKDVVVKSIGDMKAAIRFLREDAATANDFRIDSEFIFAGGISAGAITACHTAVIDSTDAIPQDLVDIVMANGGWEGNSSDNYEYSSEIQGIVNFSGGLNETDWIDAEDPPFVSFHDDMDGVVPYGDGFATVFGFPIVEMEGSFSMTAVATDVGLLNELHTIENSNGHVSYFTVNEETTAATIAVTADFLYYQLLCTEYVNNTNEIDIARYELQAMPNPTSDLLTISSISTLPSDLTLYSMTGQRLAYISQSNEINLAEFAAGLYLLEVKNAAFEQPIMLKVVRE